MCDPTFVSVDVSVPILVKCRVPTWAQMMRYLETVPDGYRQRFSHFQPAEQLQWEDRFVEHLNTLQNVTARQDQKELEESIVSRVLVDEIQRRLGKVSGGGSDFVRCLRAACAMDDGGNQFEDMPPVMLAFVFGYDGGSLYPWLDK